METSLRSFIDRMRENPTCTVAPLVYADWLEEHGFSDRAAWIRDDGRKVPRFSELPILAGLPDAFADERSVTYEFHHGMIHKIWCDHETWLRIGKAICELHPMQYVTLSDKKPGEYTKYVDQDGEPRWGWYHRTGEDVDPDDIEAAIHSHLEGGRREIGNVWVWYATEQAALDAASAACIKWGLS